MEIWNRNQNNNMELVNNINTKLLENSRKSQRKKQKQKRLENLKPCKIVLGLPINMNGDKVLDLLHI